MIKGVFFDLFFTLIYPTYVDAANEYTVLNIHVNEWEIYAENSALYRERALGYVHMKTVFAEHLISKSHAAQKEIMNFSDFHITQFSELLDFINAGAFGPGII